ncbi:MAG: polysaccharide deacetylase family protein [Anaerolineaceae bacterium]
MTKETVETGAGLTTFLDWVPLLEAHRKNLLRILVYHRIVDRPSENTLSDPSLISATPEQFEQQMSYVRQNYHLLSIIDLIQAIESRDLLPPQSLLVTFDDGYRDFLDTAWPILERYQIPSLLFLATGFLFPENQMYWWDQLYQGIYRTRLTRLNLGPIGNFQFENIHQKRSVFNELKRQISARCNSHAVQLFDQIMEKLDVIPQTTNLLLTWNEVRYLQEQGCYLATHTRNHPILSHLPAENALQEIRDSQQDLYRELGTVLPVVAYPSGHSQDCNDHLAPLLRENGFILAMSSIPGMNILPGCDLLRLKRIGVSPRVNMTVFKLVLTGVYHIYCRMQANIFHRD